MIRLCALDPRLRSEEGHLRFVRAAILSGHAYTDGPAQAAYAVMDRGFFERDFVHTLYVHPGQRRQGIGLALLRFLESASSGRLFTSTNLSNLPMQALLDRAGYRLSGVVHDLDPSDPELIYSRSLGQ